MLRLRYFVDIANQSMRKTLYFLPCRKLPTILVRYCFIRCCSPLLSSSSDQKIKKPRHVKHSPQPSVELKREQREPICTVSIPPTCNPEREKINNVTSDVFIKKFHMYVKKTTKARVVYLNHRIKYTLYRSHPLAPQREDNYQNVSNMSLPRI